MHNGEHLLESPRFLLMKGRKEEAKAIVFRLHRVKDNPDDSFPLSEYHQMAAQAEVDRKAEPGWIELFRRPTYRKRCMLAMGFAFIGQSAGVLVLNNYGPTIYAALGYDTEYQIIFQCGWISVGIIFNALGALIMDWTGRKPLLMIGVGGCCVSLVLEAVMAARYAETNTGNTADLQMGVAAAYIFQALYAVGVDVAGVVFYSELFPHHIRAKGTSLSVVIISLTDLVYLQASASAFANIEWKFYLVFIIISGFGTAFVYFVVPETKGIPLEEMTAFFGDAAGVAVYSADIHVDPTTHAIVVDEHGQRQDVEKSLNDEESALHSSEQGTNSPYGNGVPKNKVQHDEVTRV